MHLHRFEKIWLLFGGGVLILFIVLLGINAYHSGMMPPSDLNTIDPTKVDETAPFDKPGLVKVGENEYDLNMTSFAFGYAPANVEIPAGAKINFHVTSKDVVHGFEIPGTAVNAMILPGHISTVTHTFEKPGEYLILCNEYCGIAHEKMGTQIIVK